MSDLVLIVDDDSDGRAMLAAALNTCGFEVRQAADGLQALEEVTRGLPDIVLMDAVMPGMDGFQACRALKARPDFADRPVIFMTGLSETEHVVEGFRAGGVDYITKPIVLEELFARMRVHLANARMAISARSALDMAGRALFATDSSGGLLWQTPQAASLLPGGIPPELAEALRRLRPPSTERTATIEVASRQLTVSFVGEAGVEAFFRLAAPTDDREEDILRDALPLTIREADVLVWIARGKSNRDISEILNISARTVNKHLEQVFIKLGVENRAAAAVIATRVVTAR
jgi:DNA-binding NarL/FixJ family response regulator